MTTTSIEETEGSAINYFAAGGGEPMFRAILTTFYDAVFDDVMIGFHFRDADKARLIDKELEFAARALGERSIPYTGKSLRAAHGPHPIMGGQFERRTVLLQKACVAHGLPQDVIEAWLAHTNRLRHLVTRDLRDECVHRVEDQ